MGVQTWEYGLKYINEGGAVWRDSNRMVSEMISLVNYYSHERAWNSRIEQEMGPGQSKYLLMLFCMYSSIDS
ncbi:hypothetical protein B1F79_02120 [Coxiella-like endosymbiont of Rhipicephalus sanguineus]|nr:hypothetical protein [Coxiella-like endosymbiont of Rhipicephalus sanguineus]